MASVNYNLFPCFIHLMAHCKPTVYGPRAPFKIAHYLRLFLRLASNLFDQLWLVVGTWRRVRRQLDWNVVRPVGDRDLGSLWGRSATTTKFGQVRVAKVLTVVNMVAIVVYTAAMGIAEHSSAITAALCLAVYMFHGFLHRYQHPRALGPPTQLLSESQSIRNEHCHCPLIRVPWIGLCRTNLIWGTEILIASCGERIDW